MHTADEPLVGTDETTTMGFEVAAYARPAQPRACKIMLWGIQGVRPCRGCRGSPVLQLASDKVPAVRAAGRHVGEHRCATPNRLAAPLPRQPLSARIQPFACQSGLQSETWYARSMRHPRRCNAFSDLGHFSAHACMSPHTPKGINTRAYTQVSCMARGGARI